MRKKVGRYLEEVGFDYVYAKRDPEKTDGNMIAWRTSRFQKNKDHLTIHFDEMAKEMREKIGISDERSFSKYLTQNIAIMLSLEDVILNLILETNKERDLSL